MKDHEHEIQTFDFDSFIEQVVEKYKKIKSLYESLTESIQNLLKLLFKQNGIKIHSIQYRTKDIISFKNKAALPSDKNPEMPKYINPIKDITDISGVRVITLVLKTIKHVEEIINKEFVVIERIDKSNILIDKEKFGYHSIHYIVELNETRLSLPEYKMYKNKVIEIQIRTILQHAWAEIEHDIYYKSVKTIPFGIKRRFASLAGLLEIADREFQTIQDEDDILNDKNIKLIKDGKLESVNINPKSLKAYLDFKMGEDGRMTDFSYDYETRKLMKFGFNNLKEIEECIDGYDDDKISRIVFLSRLGQLTRFDLLLIAGMGDNYLKMHPWQDPEFIKYKQKLFTMIKEKGILIKNYDPKKKSE